jgi:galactofuranosylgalactofuranosylrhamnosyl-N-acetylglucosaminyl-diphospho-decaprenol beta-1,5/1,6-galactofuranosyltransferase
MADLLIQRLVFSTDRALDALYYHVDPPRNRGFLEYPAPDRFSITLRRGSTLVTDTYFNNFFENYWRRFTRLGRLRLRVKLTGVGTILLFRRSVVAGLKLIHTVEFNVDQEEVVLEVPEQNFHFRELGALHFDVIARSAEVRIEKAEWLAADVKGNAVRLVAGFCTFNRETFVLNNVQNLVDDANVADVLARIVVVDQGTSKVQEHPAYRRLRAIVKAKLLLVEQGNFGGAGGFTRSILEARSVPGATHMILMDDDAIIEPESVFRAARFLALAREEIAAGGQMLDLLRRVEVYESGASVVPGILGITSPVNRKPMDAPSGLTPFLDVTYTHYNAWWFFAFPLRLIDRVGLPLPVFIRGDDAEFGSRLHRANIPTVTVPGLGVWHEPFYTKSGSWQPYYDLRNMLVLTAIHFPVGRLHVVKTFLQRLIRLLLAMNYFEAAIVCEAVDDFCVGPQILEDDPGALHQKVLALQKEMAPAVISRASCLASHQPPAPPASRSWRKWHFVRCVIRQMFRATPQSGASPGLVIPVEHANWWSLSRIDVVALDDWYSEHYRVSRRSRELFRQTLWRGMKSAFRLYLNHDRAGRDWRASVGRLTSSKFWYKYLNLDREGSADGGRNDRTRHAA